MQEIPDLRETLSQSFNINHMSISSISNYIKDQHDFFRKHVLGQFEDFEQSPPLIIGKAVHTAIEFYWNSKKEGNLIKLETMKLAGESELERIVKTSPVNYGANSSFEICLASVKDSIDAYYNNPPNYNPIEIEKSHVILDEEMDELELLLPFKGVLDMIGEDENGVYVVDHKTVSSFTPEGQIKASYEIQGGGYYYLCKAITGKYPKKIIFDEIIKGKPDPFYGLKQADLRALCEEHKIDWETGNKGRYFTNDGMKTELSKTGKFETKVRNSYIIDFETSVAQIAFKDLFNMVCMDLYVKGKYDLKFIPNAYEYWNGDKSYIDWTSDFEKESLAF